MAYMDELILIKPNKEWEALIEDYKREHFENSPNKKLIITNGAEG